MYMKSEDTVYQNEDTQFEETQFDEKEVNETNDEAVNEEADEKKSSTWRKVAIGTGMGILLGTTTSFVTAKAVGNDAIQNPQQPVDDATEEHPAWSDGEVQIATTVTDDMSFNEAFATAREEVGPGGAFEWNGGVYGTYTAEEWDNMTPEEREEYNDHFDWNNHTSTTETTSTTESAESTSASDETAENGESGESATEENQNAGETATAEENEESEEVVVVSDNHSGNEAVMPSDEVENVEIVDSQEPEVEVLGVYHDDVDNANVVGLMVDDQEVVLIDVDNDLVVDYMASDLDGNQQLSENEILDVSQDQISISQFDAAGMDDSLYASNDGMEDYINDAPDAYDMA